MSGFLSSISIYSIIISIVYFILTGFLIIHGTYIRAGIGEKPLIYNSVVVQFVLNVLFFVWLVATILFFVINWKFAGILLIICIILGKWIAMPIAERIVWIFWDNGKFVGLKTPLCAIIKANN